MINHVPKVQDFLWQFSLLSWQGAPEPSNTPHRPICRLQSWMRVFDGQAQYQLTLKKSRSGAGTACLAGNPAKMGVGAISPCSRLVGREGLPLAQFTVDAGQMSYLMLGITNRAHLRQ